MYNNKFLLYSFILGILSSMYLFKDYLFIIFIAILLSLSTKDIYTSLTLFFSKINIKIISKNKELIISSFLSLAFLLFILVPFTYILKELLDIFADLNISKSTFIDINNHLKSVLYNLPYPINIFQNNINIFLNDFSFLKYFQDFKILINKITTLLIYLNNTFFDFLILMTFYFFINLYSRNIKYIFFRVLPINKDKKRKLINNLTKTNIVVLYGIIFNMIIQGFFFGIFISLFTNYNGLFFGIFFGFLSIIPIIGASIIYIPLVIFYIYNGNYYIGISLFLYSFIFIGMYVDNILKMKFINYISKKIDFKYKMNEILMIISMIVSINIIGFWGIIIGPAIISITITLLNLNIDRKK